MECNFWLSPFSKQHQNPFFGSSSMYQDLSMHHDWPVKKAMVNMPVSSKGNLKCISGNLLSPLRAQNKEFGAASQTLLSRVSLQYICSTGYM